MLAPRVPPPPPPPPPSFTVQLVAAVCFDSSGAGEKRGERKGDGEELLGFELDTETSGGGGTDGEEKPAADGLLSGGRDEFRGGGGGGGVPLDGRGSQGGRGLWEAAP